jgi:hypothetical protein
MEAEHGNVIHVDFAARRRLHGPQAAAAAAAATQLLPEPSSAVVAAEDFLVFWRLPQRSRCTEYLGGRWNRGWMLFVWTSDDFVGPTWRTLVEARGYRPHRLDRSALRELVTRSAEVVGLIVNGDIDAEMRTIRAAPQQMVPRVETLRLLQP